MQHFARRTRITVVCSHALPDRSPEAAHAAFLCERLALAGAQVTLLTSSTPVRSRVESYRLMATVRSWTWASLPRLLVMVRRSRPDAVLLLHVGWIYGFHPMVTFLPLALRLTNRRTATVTQLENLQTIDHPRWSPILRGVARLMPRRWRFDEHLGALVHGSDRLIFLSEQHCDRAVQRAPNAEAIAEVIPAPPLLRIHPDPPEARRTSRSKLGLADDELAIIYVGYVYRGKGLETALRALSRVDPTTPTLLLILGGVTEADYATELEDLAGSLPPHVRISWLGDFNPDEDLASEYLFASDLCLLPFDDGVLLNNSSFSVAASHGLAILTTRGAGTEDAFVDRDVAWLIPPRDPLAMAEAIDRLRSDAALRERLGQGASRYASDTSSWEVVIAKTAATLQAAVDIATRGRRR